MAASKFILEIELGNDAMKRPSDVSNALSKIAEQVKHVAGLKGITTKILDVNGNSVGSWGYK
jgi:hypothetical protein